MRKISSVIMVIALTLAACGGGGSGSSAPSWSGSVNSSGYPDVTGTYAVVIPAGTISCSDGASNSTTSYSGNVTVTQSGNAISLSSSDSLPAGWTLVSSTAPAGNVEKSGTFITNSSAVVTAPTLSGTISISTNTEGSFTTSGVSGTKKGTYSFSSYTTSCTVTTTFTGTKL